LFDALVVRTSVPATLHLVNVAAGRIDAFWQFAGARADLLPGALLVTEAGGRISDAQGRPWTPQSEGFLASAPGVHAEAVATLSR
ncbi:inositol monophosphatase family protein, partial [Streptomyces sp. NPDC059389]